MQEFPGSKTYRLMEPGPVLLVTTSHQGRATSMTIGFRMMVQHAPPLIGCIIGPWDSSDKALRATGACVFALPGVDLATKVVDIGNCSGDEGDTFETFHRTQVPAKEVKAPLVHACLANVECRVKDTSLAGKYRLFRLGAVSAYISPERKAQRTIHHRGDGTFTVDGRVITLQERMVKWKSFQD
jgi:flavin reductase (DIM6/NTAB) family NADH-FMN oxidoreductase RutF